MKRVQALTLIESLVVLVITAVLMAILVPVIGAAKQSAKIQNSVQNLRQLHMNLQMYRSDADGSDSTFDSYYGLGLPPVAYARGALFVKHAELHKSPCGLNASAFESSGYSLNPGHIDPVFGLCDPSLGPGQSKRFREYIAARRENFVTYVDVNCNAPGTILSDPYATKRGLAVLFSGQLVNKNDRGIASNLDWYSEPAGSQ